MAGALAYAEASVETDHRINLACATIRRLAVAVGVDSVLTEVWAMVRKNFVAVETSLRHLGRCQSTVDHSDNRGSSAELALMVVIRRVWPRTCSANLARVRSHRTDDGYLLRVSSLPQSRLSHSPDV